MLLRNKRLLSLAVAFLLIFGIAFTPVYSNAEEKNLNITIIGTTDIHANIYNWSYEDGIEKADIGMAKVYSVIEAIRKENPNTLLIDNGDTIQGTILADDLYNTKLDLKHPVIDVMNFMGYDSMTLGNHEFNFGIDLIDKMAKEAEFPILAANATNKDDGSYLVKPYVIIEVAGVKVGILGITNPNIPKWDGPKVTGLVFDSPVASAEKHIKQMKSEGVDVIVLSTHMGYESEYGGDGADEIIAKFPEVAAVLTGHAHTTENQKVGNTLVGAAKDAGRQVVRFDFELAKENGMWKIVDSKVSVIDVNEYTASQELKDYATEYHEKTLEFLVEVLGTASKDFAPQSEIPGIPEAQIRDTGVIDLINDVQLKYTGADIAAAALFSQTSNLRAGNITYANIFEIYKYPNTLVGVEVTGAELKAYMEWSAKYYNTYVPGDINLSFNPSIRGYNYDMFQGVDYKIDVSKPEGNRIVGLKFKGKAVKDTDTFKISINNYRYGGLKSMGIISGEPYFESDPKSLRSFIADYIKENSPITPVVDNNWEVIGADFNHPLRNYLIGEIKAGRLELPKSEDGRSYNAKAINADEMIKAGLIPDELLVEKYVVKSGDALYKIGWKYKISWKKIAEYNKLVNPNLIFPNQVLLIPKN
ncbi:MAG: 5-Nucleotidase domain protein [Clostridiales bacterium]|nr:5-Nucleotidase domain protein [Clostridiales bacterium]